MKYSQFFDENYGYGDKNVGNIAYMDYPDISFHTQEVGISPSDNISLIFRIADHSEISLKVMTSTNGHHFAINHLFETRQDFLEV